MSEEKQTIAAGSAEAESPESKVEENGIDASPEVSETTSGEAAVAAEVPELPAASAEASSNRTEVAAAVPETLEESARETSHTAPATKTLEKSIEAPSEEADVSEVVVQETPKESAGEPSDTAEPADEPAVARETLGDPAGASSDAVESADEPEAAFQETSGDTAGAPSDAAESVDESSSETREESVVVSSDTAEVAEAESSDPSDTASDEAEPPESVDIPQEDASPTPEDIDDQPLRVGYTGEILGEVVPLSSLDAQMEATEEEQLEAEELIKLIDSSLSRVSKDEIVTGRIIAISDKDVVIDIGFKSDGVIPKSEFSGELSIGDEVEVYLERIENYHGQLVLSKERAEQVRRWEKVEDSFRDGTVLEGTITRRIKGGMLVDLLDGLEAFLPGSQIDMRPVRDFDSYIDRKMEFKIVKINAENENVVVSHKALIERELASQRESILSTMETGQVLEGVAKNITDFGVFVDLGGVDGLLHITDLTWGRVSHPTEVVSLDEELKVVVLEYDRERQRISLGLKQLQPHPWDNIKERYKEGDVVEGKVVSITDYGAFLELEQGIEGLVHVSEMSWTGHIRHPSQRVSLGQIVKVSVMSIDDNVKKISLGMKQFEANPWEGIATRYPPGTVLRGKVRNITHFGAFVEIEPGIDGLVHVSDLSWTKTIRHPSELIKKRQELSVVVLDVDEKRQRIALGHKQIETNPWTNLSTVYETGTDHKAKVVRIDRKGLTVELPLEIEAFVPGNELKNKHESGGFPPYQEGDELDLRVIRLDVDRKEIVMSETARARQEKVKERQKEEGAKRAERRAEEKAVRQHAKREQVASGPTTVGELSGLESLKGKLREEEKASRKKAKKTKAKKAESVDTETSDVKVAEAGDTKASEAEAAGSKSSDAEAPVAEVADVEPAEVEAPAAMEAEPSGAEEPVVETANSEPAGAEILEAEAADIESAEAEVPAATEAEPSGAEESAVEAADAEPAEAEALATAEAEPSEAEEPAAEAADAEPAEAEAPAPAEAGPSEAEEPEAEFADAGPSGAEEPEAEAAEAGPSEAEEPEAEFADAGPSGAEEPEVEAADAESAEVEVTDQKTPNAEA